MNLPNISAVKLGTMFETSRIAAMAAPIGAMIVSISILIFVVWPKISSVLVLRTANRDLAVRVENLASKVQTLSSLDKVELASDVVYAEQLLPSDKGVFSIIRQIELAAGSSGVVLTKLDVTPGALNQDDSSSGAGANAQQGAKSGETPEAAPKIQLKVAIASDYNSFLNFLANIYSIARVTSINDLTISSSAAQGVTAPLKINTVINTFWKPMPSKLGLIESSVSKLTDAELARLAKVKNIVENPVAASSSAVPQVPTGRSDLFTPF